MKLKELHTREGQAALFDALVKWEVAQGSYATLSDMLNSQEAISFIADYIEDSKDSIYSKDVATKLRDYFLTHMTMIHTDMFNLAKYDLAEDRVAFMHSLPELSSTDKLQPDSINKLLCDQFSSISKDDVFLFPCAGRGSDAQYVCSHYGVSKDNCYFIEIDERLCLRLIDMGFENVIDGNILSKTTWEKLYNMLGDNMKKITRVIMNPPYDGSLHLNILATTLDAVKKNNPDCEVVSIQPARWLEDPLAEYKQGSDAIKYKKSITEKISKLQLVDATTACKSFNIMNATDLGIYTFNNNAGDTVVNKQAKLIEKLLAKITTMNTLADKIEAGKVDGYRCEVKELTSGTGGHNLGDYESSKLADVNIIWGPYSNGYTEDGKFFTDARQKNQFTKQYFRFSIPAETAEINKNFMLSCNTKFYKRLVQLLKCDVHAPIKFLPYMEDYSHVWTDEDYCKFFGLTEEESEFMCRTVEDYRVKDFINYIQLDKED